MRQILMTTAIAGMLAAVPAFAQTSTDTTGATGVAITAPEGYQSSDLSTLTFEELQGASVYDSNGESVGDISDFVMQMDASAGTSAGASNTSTDTTAGTAADTMATDTTAADTTATDTTAADTNAADTTAADTTAADTTATGTTAADTTATDTTATDTTAADTTAADTTAADTAATDTTTAAGTDANATAGSDANADMAAGTDTGATTAAGSDATTTAAGTDTMAADATNGGVAAGRTGSISGQVSHVVLDIGGFLGIGEHTVAVPIEALQVFRGASANDVRVYLPWTEDQLKALPEYAEGDPSTYGMMAD